MTNNEIILKYLKANLGKDLNDNYDELGCAQTVNNVLKNCLGYVAGGGASTAKMLKEIVVNPNFKRVTKNEARAGDIVLSATGTGNGKIDHGHVGFLGENGVIYSNNSSKDMLDDHLTASDWKNYFALKGGFPVHYFRAVGESKIYSTPVNPKTPVKNPLSSSDGSGKLSTTIQGLITLLIPVIVTYLTKQNITITESEVSNVLNTLFIAGGSLVTLYGLLKKLNNKFK